MGWMSRKKDDDETRRRQQDSLRASKEMRALRLAEAERMLKADPTSEIAKAAVEAAKKRL
ncbi:hypothetical protein GCM10027294_25990 [Marinactinospora endophytica]